MSNRLFNILHEFAVIHEKLSSTPELEMRSFDMQGEALHHPATGWSVCSVICSWTVRVNVHLLQAYSNNRANFGNPVYFRDFINYIYKPLERLGVNKQKILEFSPANALHSVDYAIGFELPETFALDTWCGIPVGRLYKYLGKEFSEIWLSALTEYIAKHLNWYKKEHSRFHERSDR